jgi:hypothetical protein
MRKTMIAPAVVLSVMSFGMIAQAVPASAHPASFVAGEDDGEDVPPTNNAGGSGAPSGGAATGAGGSAVEHTSDVAPFLATGAAGIGMLGLATALRRRRTVGA